MPGEETLGKSKATILPERAFKLPGWETLGKHKAIQLREHASELLGWETFGKTKAMVVLDYDGHCFLVVGYHCFQTWTQKH